MFPLSPDCILGLNLLTHRLPFPEALSFLVKTEPMGLSPTTAKGQDPLHSTHGVNTK